MQRILIVRMGSLGDIVHTLPVAATLKHAFPEAEIDWLVERQWLPLLARNPYLSRVHVVETRTWRKRPTESATWRSFFALVSTLRSRRYDCALDFQGLVKSALLARLAKARKVIGWHRDELREPPAHFFHHDTAPSIEPGVLHGSQAASMHVVHRNLALAARAGAVEPVLDFTCRASAEDEEWFRRWSRSSLSAGRAMATTASDSCTPAYAVISPGVGWEAKRWPADSFAQLAERIRSELGWSVVINCGPGDEKIAERVANLAPKAAPILMKPTVGQLIPLVSHASLVVAGDTGPLHLAAACGAPVVGIYGPTDPLRNGPFGVACRVVRPASARTTYSRKASRDSIREVTPIEVFEAAMELVQVSQ